MTYEAITDLDRITQAMEITGPIEEMIWEQIDQPHAWNRVEQIAQQLEIASCAAGSWNSVVLTRDIEEKLSDPDWVDCIDEALADWRDNTGESYGVESVSDLVTFAVDETTHKLAMRLRSLDRVAVVTAACDAMDPKPDRIAFDTVWEAEEWISEEVQSRVSYRVEHSPYAISEEERDQIEEEELALFTLTDERL